MSSPALVGLPLAAALPPLLMLLFPSALARRAPRAAGAAARGAALLSLLLGGSAALAIDAGPIQGRLAGWGVFGLTVYFDVVSAIMFLLVAFLGAAVLAFSRNYLAGDPAQGRFVKWLSITVGCVLLLTVAGNLALFTLAWMGTSLSLHQLLTFYPDRRGAVLAAREKYVFSRIGDLFLIGALVLAGREFGTLDYAPLFAAVQAAPPSAALTALAFLLAGGAMLKSAQFPFHGWLPETMETPTPVSALMHAGIINAGGFLVIRCSPLVSVSPGAMAMLAGVGAFTALFASLVMITQTSVKRSLAFSTVAQMGFMMLQCGLGAFALAFLHLVAHSLYKSHAFLSCGNGIAEARAAGSPLPPVYRGGWGIVLAFAVAAVIVGTVAALAGEAAWSTPSRLALSLVLLIALAQLLWNWWARSASPGVFMLGAGLAAAVGGLSFGLHGGFEWLLRDSVAAAPVSGVAWAVAIVSPLAFLLVAARVFLPPDWTTTPAGRVIFVHAYNGFYVNTLAKRLLLSRQMSAGLE